jgi:DNA-binding transcriptional ArsR family regulator
MADIFAVVADGTRREILRVLHDRAEHGAADTSVSQLVADLGLSQPTVSKHLKVLRECSLVVVREQGQHRFYRVNPQPLEEVASWLDLLRAGDAARPSGETERPDDSQASTPPGAEPGRTALGPRAREFAGALGRSLAGAGHRVGGAARRVWPSEHTSR